MDMNKKEKGIATVAAILVGCGVAIGAMATKIYLDKTKEYREEVKRLKKETDFKLSKEFLKELKEELKDEQNAKVVVVKVNETSTATDSSEAPEQTQNSQEIPVNSVENAQDEDENVSQVEDVSIKIEVVEESN